MGRMYSVQFNGVAVTAQQDFFEIAPADDKPCIIHAIYLSQDTEVGDAMEEFLRVLIKRGATTSGTGGTTPTPSIVGPPSDTAAGFTAEVNNTTKATTGTIVTLHADTFNERVGWVWIPTPECRPHVTQAQSRLTVELATTPADSVTMCGTIYVEELG